MGTISSDLEANRLPFDLGCPVFSTRSWVGSVLPADTSVKDHLKAYAQLFSAVEGSSTFYGLPSSQTVAKWTEDVPEAFQFVFKMPKEVTHEKELVGADAVVSRFLDTIAPLTTRLGPILIQLPPYFSPSKHNVLVEFLRRLPQQFRYVVEVRHLQWFDNGPNEQMFLQILQDFGAGRTILDSRPLFAKPAADAATLGAQKRKPKSPPRTHAVGQFPVLRLIGRNDVANLSRWLNGWAKVVHRWIDEGRRPLVFCHTPDEHFAPQMVRKFYAEAQTHNETLKDLPDWPLTTSPSKQQIKLF